MDAKTYIINVQGAIYHDDKYLMMRRSDQESYLPGEVGMPGGKTEQQDESAEDVILATLHREIMEEVNVRVTDCELLITCFFEANGIPVINVVYICRYLDGEAKAVDPTETAEVMWMSAEETLKHPDCREWTHLYIRKAEEIRKKRISEK